EAGRSTRLPSRSRPEAAIRREPFAQQPGAPAPVLFARDLPGRDGPQAPQPGGLAAPVRADGEGGAAGASAAPGGRHGSPLRPRAPPAGGRPDPLAPSPPGPFGGGGGTSGLSWNPSHHA